MFFKKGRLFSVFLIFILLCSCAQKEPIEVKNFKGSITLDKSGDAEFEEIWTISALRNGEFLKPMDVGAIESDSLYCDEELLKKNETWDKNDNNPQYAVLPKEGIVWSVKKGKFDYKIKYKIKTFSLQTSKDQRLFWQFISKSTKYLPKKVNIDIVGPFKQENTQVRISGMDGNIHFEKEGHIVIKGSNPDFLTLNVVIDDIVFKQARAVEEKGLTDKDYDKGVNSDEVAKGVVSGSKKSNTNSSKSSPIKSSGNTPSNSKTYSTGTKSFYLSFLIIILAIAAVSIFNILKKKFEKKKKERIAAYFKSLDELRKEVEGEVISDSPIESIYYAYAFLKSLRISDFCALTIVYIIMEMIKAGICSVEGGSIHLLEDKDESKVRLDWKPMWELMKQAQDENGKVTSNDFIKVAKKNKGLIKKFYNEINERSLGFLFQEAYALDLSNVENSFDRKALKDIGMIFTDRGKEIAYNFARYANFLHQFSIYALHKDYQVKIWQGEDFSEPNYKAWENHLLFAMMMGMQGRLQREMEKAYEDFDTEISFNQTTFRYLSILAKRVVEKLG